LFAATYRDRTAALVVRSAYPRRMWAPDYPWGLTERDYAREVEHDLGIFSPRRVPSALAAPAVVTSST
jgi:hypothetical protein